MQSCFGSLHRRWEKANERRRGVLFGIDAGKPRQRLFELRFADDVLLFAQQPSDTAKMLLHLSEAASKYGLKINYAKTKILTASHWAGGRTSLKIGVNNVAILVDDRPEKYLGRKLCFTSMHEVELNHRIAAGWAAFHIHKGELCNRSYRVTDRIKLFNAVVTPVILYGAAAWAMTALMEKHLYTVWRRMLRYVFCIHRRSEQLWIDFLKRGAQQVEDLASELCVESWVHTYRRAKWRFARRLATATDNRWSHHILHCVPSDGDGRGCGRPKTRWMDSIIKVAGGHWLETAHDSAQWALLEEGYVENVT